MSKRAVKITLDPSHPAHSFDQLPSGQRYRALSTRTTRHRNSFFPRRIAHNIRLHTKLSIVIYLYIQLSICIPYLRVLFNSSFYYLFFCSVTLLHCGSFCHENKFLICVNIPGNKAHSDSSKCFSTKTSSDPWWTIQNNDSVDLNPFSGYHPQCDIYAPFIYSILPSVTPVFSWNRFIHM